MNEILRDAEILFAFLGDTEDASDKADVVLAMGGSDLSVADTAAKAFFERRAGWLICTGGFGKDTAGILPYPESVMYAKRCMESGVPGDRILIEDRSTNSGENFRYGKALLEERGVFPRTGVIASKPYMAKRAWATAAKQWPEVRWSVACQRIGFMEYLAQKDDTEKILNLMVGDLQRLRAYAGTFQEPVAVPDAIWAVYERLVTDGYDKFVIRGA
ncbi:MAG: YdcF family protein [Oscillibacter sp.]|nr:YdcF family protein [Oscillibacter sp.]